MTDMALIVLAVAAAVTVVTVAGLAFLAFRLWLAHRESGAEDELQALRGEVKALRDVAERAESTSLRALHEAGTVGAVKALGTQRR